MCWARTHAIYMAGIFCASYVGCYFKIFKSRSFPACSAREAPSYPSDLQSSSPSVDPQGLPQLARRAHGMMVKGKGEGLPSWQSGNFPCLSFLLQKSRLIEPYVCTDTEGAPEDARTPHCVGQSASFSPAFDPAETTDICVCI